MNGKHGEVDASLLPSEEFRRLLLALCAEYGAYPSFKVVVGGAPVVDGWGKIILPRVPKDVMKPDEKYFLLVTAGYNLISPRTERNRLMMRAIISKVFKAGWFSAEVSALSGLISTLMILAELRTNERLLRRFRDALSWAERSLEDSHDAVSAFLKRYISLVRGYPVPDDDLARTALALLEVLSSPTSFDSKVEQAARALREIVPKLRVPKLFGRSVQRLSPSLGEEGEERSWGRNPTGEKASGSVSPKVLQQIARINFKMALELAKKLDREEEERKGTIPAFARGKLPGYSDRLRMYQKLLKRRRYIAAVRKVKLSEVFSAVDKMFSRGPGRSPRGFTEWVMGDDEEELDIEASAETFGVVIPGLSTLKKAYEISGDQGRRGREHFEIVIDTSGSMDGMPLERAIEVAVALVEYARKMEYSVALTTFSSGAWEGVPPGHDYDAVEDIILRLMADGGTNIRGVMGILEDHLSFITSPATIFFITDTAIWDIGAYGVRRKMRELSARNRVYLIAITDELYEDTRASLRGSDVRLVVVPPEAEGSWLLVLDDYVRMEEV